VERGKVHEGHLTTDKVHCLKRKCKEYGDQGEGEDIKGKRWGMRLRKQIRLKRLCLGMPKGRGGETGKSCESTAKPGRKEETVTKKVSNENKAKENRWKKLAENKGKMLTLGDGDPSLVKSKELICLKKPKKKKKEDK